MDGVVGDPASQIYWYHTDHLGSVQVVSDAQGQVVWRNEYRAFGEQLGPEVREIENAHAFTGKDWDEEVGLYYFNARWYEPELGRFVEEDAYKGEPNDPRTLNRYTYGLNNSLIHIDPTGHWNYVFKDGKVYAVAEDDDTLWDLSKTLYGTGLQYTQLRYSGKPELLQIGEQLDITGGYKQLRAQTVQRLTVEYNQDVPRFNRVVNAIGANNASEVFFQIEKYMDVINTASDTYNVPKSMISAILFREISFYDPLDAVDQYTVLKIRGDASLGLGQVRIGTAMRAEDILTGDCKYTRDEILARLLDPETNIEYVTMTLASIAQTMGIDLTNCTDDERQKVLAAYNGSGTEAQEYGREVNDYVDIFEDYYGEDY